MEASIFCSSSLSAWFLCWGQRGDFGLWTPQKKPYACTANWTLAMATCGTHFRHLHIFIRPQWHKGLVSCCSKLICGTSIQVGLRALGTGKQLRLPAVCFLRGSSGKSWPSSIRKSKCKAIFHCAPVSSNRPFNWPFLEQTSPPKKCHVFPIYANSPAGTSQQDVKTHLAHLTASRTSDRGKKVIVSNGWVAFLASRDDCIVADQVWHQTLLWQPVTISSKPMQIQQQRWQRKANLFCAWLWTWFYGDAHLKSPLGSASTETVLTTITGCICKWGLPPKIDILMGTAFSSKLQWW